MRGSRTYNIILLSILGSIFLGGLILSSLDVVLLFKGERLTGIVAEVSCVISCKNILTKIVFTDSNNVQHTYSSFDKLNPMFKKGDTAIIYYDHNNPNRSMVFSLFTFISPLLFFSFLLMVLFGIKYSSKE